MPDCPNCGHHLDDPKPPFRIGGTRVDQILSPDELAELIEDCRRPLRPVTWRPLR